MLESFGDRLDRIKEALGVGLSVFSDEIQKISAKLRSPTQETELMKYFDEAYFAKLGLPLQQVFIDIVRTGFENADSGLGLLCHEAGRLRDLSEFFDPLIRDYHGASPDAVHVTDWDISDVGENGVLDVTKLGLPTLSMRVRVGRNLTGFNLPGNMDRAERVRFEKSMLKAFKKLQEMPEYGGKVYSLTPDFDGAKNPNKISDEKYKELVKAHVMSKDMDADPYPKSAGISSDWPYGRGCWQSDDGQCIIWFGEEDQLRIMYEKRHKVERSFHALEGYA